MASYAQSSYGKQTDFSVRPKFVYDSDAGYDENRNKLLPNVYVYDAGVGFDTNAAKRTGGGGGGESGGAGFTTGTLILLILKKKGMGIRNIKVVR